VIERRVDWGTLVFFLMLFIVVGALQATGVTGVVAHALLRGTGVIRRRWSGGRVVDGISQRASGQPAGGGGVYARRRRLERPRRRLSHGGLLAHALWRHLHGEHDQHRFNVQHHRLRHGGSTRTWNDLFAPWLKIGVIVSLASMALATFLLAIQTHWLSRG